MKITWTWIIALLIAGALAIASTEIGKALGGGMAYWYAGWAGGLFAGAINWEMTRARENAGVK